MRRILCAVLMSLTAATALPSTASAETPSIKMRPTPVAPTPRHAPSRALTVAPKKSILSADAALARMTITELRAEWQHVAICEVNGNWAMTGPSYSGIGFSNSTWLQYGGSRFAPLAGEANRDVQILIGMKVTGGWIPDQQGCSRYGW